MKRARAIASVAVLVLVTVGAAGVWRVTLSATEDRALVDHTRGVIEAAQDVLHKLIDAETSQRGYLLTGRNVYLQPFGAAAPQIDTSIARLQELTADNQVQQANLEQLRKFADAKLAELQRTIELRRTEGFNAAVAEVDSDFGKQAMDQIRSVIASIQAEEQRLLGIRSAATATADWWALRGAAATALLSLFALGYGLILLRAAEQRLERSSARLRATIENVPQGVVLVDPRCCVVEWNPRLIKLLGLSLPIKREITTAAELQANLSERLEGAPRLFAVPPPEQTAFAIGDRSLEVVGRTLAAGGAIWTIQDVTERRMTERIAVQSQRLEAVGLMTGGIAHHFNNLLTAVLGNLELASKKIEDRPQVVQMLRRAELAAQHGRSLVAQLLSFDRHQPIVAQRVVDPRALIEQMADVFRNTLGSKFTLRLELGNIHDRLLIDPGQLELGLLNLVLNARDAMRGGAAGALTIALSAVHLAAPNARLGGIAPGRYVQIRITDTGIGMTEEVRARAFEPFFTTKDVGQGSGLGLSQTYGMVRQLRGAITLDSTYGQGTTATLYLPIAIPVAVPGPEAPRETVSTWRVSQSSRGRILVVEDDELVRDFTAEILRDLGYEVLEAGDSDAGWEILATADRIDLLCTDIMMPGTMDGFQLAQKARRRRPDLRLVYMSGYPDKALETAKPANGNVPYIAKPFSGRELAEGVARAMGR